MRAEAPIPNGGDSRFRQTALDQVWPSGLTPVGLTMETATRHSVLRVRPRQWRRELLGGCRWCGLARRSRCRHESLPASLGEAEYVTSSRKEISRGFPLHA